MQQTLVIVKPDGVNRGIVGEVVHRFERRGLKIVGMKMMHLSDEILDIHYEHHKEKPFYQKLKDFMKSAPSVILVLEGKNVVEIVRMMVGPTRGYEASPGTVRGDYSVSQQHNIIHASDVPETAEKEIKRFFKDDEIVDYKRIDWEMVYAVDER